MTLSLPKPFAIAVDPNPAIASLWTELGDAGKHFAPPRCRAVNADELSEPFHSLLVHGQHLIFTLERHYDAPMQMVVLATHQQDNQYTRLVRLTPQGASVPAAHTLVAIDLSLLPGPTAREVLRCDRPVGEVLIRHAIHTHIATRCYVKVEPQPSITSAPTIDWLAATERFAFGRVSRIFCEAAPAVRTLEIITGAAPAPSLRLFKAADALG